MSAVVLLFAGAALVCAAPVDMNGQFKRYSKKSLAPVDWGLNMAPAAAKKIKVTVQPSQDPKQSNVLIVDTTKGSGAPLRHTKGFPCKAGDKVVFSADVTAVGGFSVNFTKYGKKGFLKSQGKGFRLLGRKTPVKFEIVLTEDKNPKILHKVHMVMNFPKGKISRVENLKVELIPAAAKK